MDLNRRQTLAGALACTAAAALPAALRAQAAAPTPAAAPGFLTPFEHASLMLTLGGQNILVDPVGGADRYAAAGPLAAVLVTHEHGDHLSPDTIELLSKDDTQILLNAKSRDQLGKGEAIANGESRKVGPVGVTAVPAYNISEGRQNFHPKGNGNGYILDFDGFKVYVAGDTEDIDEMASFGPIDVAFLPVNQPYTMTTTQCIEAAMTLKPKVLIPYHMSQTDIQEVKTVLDANDSGIEVLLFEELR